MACAQGVPPRESRVAMLLGIIGFILSAMLSNLAVGSAPRHRIKVWVGARANHAKTILYSALITNAILLLLVMIMVFMWVLLLDAKAIPPAAVISCFVLLVFGAPVLILLRLDTFRQRIIAASSDECWPDDPEPSDRLCHGENWE
jgi:hypothetical protein